MNLKQITWFLFLIGSGLTLAGMGAIVSISPVSAGYNRQQPTKTPNSTTAAQSTRASEILLSQTSRSPNSQSPKPQNSSAPTPLCYMVSPDGKMIDLQALCGQSSPSSTSSSKNNTNLSTPNQNFVPVSSPTQGNNVDTP